MIRFSEFERNGAAVAAFSEKSDGACGLKGVSFPQEILNNRASVCRVCGVNEARMVCAQQIHSPHVAWVGSENSGAGALTWESGIPATDGLACRESGLPLGILVADCVPLYLVDPVRKAAALVHAGREGTRANIAGNAVAALAAGAGSAPGDLCALVGPSAGPCCYEVSHELAQDFAGAGLPVHGRNLDLWEANALQLTQAGVLRTNIALTALCTICDGRFFSFRSGDATGRNVALLML